jgi:importin subunit alpha-1
MAETNVDDLLTAMEDLALERLNSNGNAERKKVQSMLVLTDEETMFVGAAIRQAESLLQYTGVLDHDGALALHQCVQSVRKLLSRTQSPPIADILRLGGLPVMLQAATAALITIDLPTQSLLQDAPFALRVDIGHEALWAVNNLASGASDCTEMVVEGGAVPILVTLAGHPIHEIACISCWAIGNISGDGARLRDSVIEAGAVDAVSSAINAHAVMSEAQGGGYNLPLLRNCTWTLSNLMRFKPSPPATAVEPALILAVSLLQNIQDEEVAADALWCFAYAVEGANERDVMDYACRSGILPGVVSSVLSSNTVLSAAALRLAGNIVTGDDAQTQSMINAGIVPAVVHGLASGHFRRITREAYWLLSNIAAGNRDQIQLLLDPCGDTQTVPASCAICALRECSSDSTPQTYDVAREAAWIVSNILSGGSPDQTQELVNLGVVDAMLTFVSVFGLRHSRLTCGLLGDLSRLVQDSALQRHTIPDRQRFFDVLDPLRDQVMDPELDTTLQNLLAALGA